VLFCFHRTVALPGLAAGAVVSIWQCVWRPRLDVAEVKAKVERRGRKYMWGREEREVIRMNRRGERRHKLAETGFFYRLQILLLVSCHLWSLVEYCHWIADRTIDVRLPRSAALAVSVQCRNMHNGWEWQCQSARLLQFFLAGVSYAICATNQQYSTCKTFVNQRKY